MSRLSLHPHREQQPLLAAYTTKRPAPARTARACAADVIADLRAEDAIHAEIAAARAKLLLTTHRPSSALPTLLAEAEHVVASRDAACVALFAEDRARRDDIAAAAWVDDAIGAEMRETSAAVLDAVAARPELRHDAALLMALTPVVAMLKAGA